MKSVYKAVAVAFVFALLLAPAAAIICGDNSDAASTIEINDAPEVTSKFDDRDAGTVKVIVTNKDVVAQTVIISIKYYSDYIEGDDYTLADKTVEIPAEQSADVSISFSFGSRGDKDLTVVAYDIEGNELTHNNFSVSVGHSIWKDPVTYIVIVLVVIVVIVIVVIKVRASGVGKKGKKVDPNQPTFTQMEEERQAKKIERKSKR